MMLPSKIVLCEVGLRDGLQNEAKILSTSEKVNIAEGLIQAGFKVIELGSFMHPKAVPQMANTDELFQLIKQPDDVELRALIANRKGVERAVSCGCKKVKLNVSVSKGHNLANLNMTPEESIAGFINNAEFARENGLQVSGSISMPFGSPWEGIIHQQDIEVIINAYLKAGINEISLSDASGMATPKQVYELTSKLQTKYPEVTWWLHFHNTRGLGIANILAAMQAGITRFDSSLGALGGCPFVPGAAGNVSTEDIIHMMDEMDISTGINITEIINLSKELQHIIGHELDSYILKAGRSKDLLR